jgi:hypothetical protein
MQDLKAVQAREIDKATITEAETLVVNGEMVNKAEAPAMQAGDFYFRPNVVATNGSEPTGFFKRLVWKLKGSPVIKRERIVYTVVISCPFCGLAFMTGFSHHIVSKNPLTITEPIACPYSSQDPAKAHSFLIKDGKIIAA